MRKINVKICSVMLLMLTFAIGVFFISAERGVWTDSGNYSAEWLGDYTNTSAYTVKDSAELAAFASAAKQGYTFEGKTVTVVDNIDMSSNYWESIYSQETMFLGTFDGQGHIIRGIEFQETAEKCAFILYNAGTIKNLTLSIKTYSKECAGVALYNSANIYNCEVSGSIGTLTSTLVGGIAGENRGNISNCINVAALSRSDADTGVFCGAISAKNEGTVESSVWHGAEKEVGEGESAQNSVKYTDASAAAEFLNIKATAQGYCEWVLDNTGIFDGYPVMKNAAPEAIAVSGIMFSQRELNIRMGESYTLDVTFYPSDASNRSLVWQSSNESVATVDENGVIGAVSEGYSIIRATAVDGGAQVNCYIRVVSQNAPILSESIRLDRTEYSLLLGQSEQIIATVLPKNASDRGVVYTVEDEGVVTCDKNGTLTPVASGVTVVTVRSADANSVIAVVVSVHEEKYSSIWDKSVATEFAGGDGTKENPYIIETPSQLAKLAQDVNSGNSYEDCYFVQAISIRLNDTTYEDWKNRTLQVNDWTPIGMDSEHVFCGNYDGRGFSVNGINIDRDWGAGGLFGYTRGGIIENVNIKHSYIKAGEFTGALVGCNFSVIIKCNAEAIVIGKNYTGGVAGYSSEKMEFCQNSSEVSGENYVGGIAGYADRYIINCVNLALIEGEDCVGGICGKNTSVIENCYNNALIRAKSFCGGIVGEITMDAVNCHNFIMPEGISNIGTIAGYCTRPVSSYVPSNMTAVGNLNNSKDYVLTLNLDGSYNSNKYNKPYIDVLNFFGGCIYSDTYFEWGYKDYIIAPMDYVKSVSSAADTVSGTELSGIEIADSSSYIFENLSSDMLTAALSKINKSSMLEKIKLVDLNVLYSKKISFVSTEQNATQSYGTFRLSIPFDITGIPNYELYGEISSFAHIALVNVSGDNVYIYIPESIKETDNGGFYIGSLKCISHSVNQVSAEASAEDKHCYSFYYKDKALSLAVQNIGEWFAVTLDEIKNEEPVDTGTSEVPTEQEKSGFSFKTVITVIAAVLLMAGAFAVIIIQRSKNNYRIILSHEDEEDSDIDT